MNDESETAPMTRAQIAKAARIWTASILHLTEISAGLTEAGELSEKDADRIEKAMRRIANRMLREAGLEDDCWVAGPAGLLQALKVAEGRSERMDDDA
jgi:hypothetical protein